MQDALRAQIARVREITEPEDLWVATRDYFFARGVRMIGYRHFVGSVRQEHPDDTMFISEGFPDELIDTLFSQRMVLVSPIPDIAARTTDPFFWSDVPKMTELLSSESAFLETVARYELGDGLAVQVFGPMSRNGVLNLGFGPGRPTCSHSELKEFQLAAQLSHLAYIRLTPDFVQGDKRLTRREREVLEWIAKGKSNSVIADILGISTHTVDTHVRRIFQKLGVSDRTTAAVKGLGAGLVNGTA
ncbi:LuxR family transcriptional regulator [Tropicimonas sp. IMCC6043]|uniref:helix-turn-helix transcriptional regulator n=1 Tax=Tropicimonas sp. IMCC6043 TaxID=2510645 RepID=UPI00101DC007|nr:LuxR family transcriptional regulator [Tropicimonas sp. IMCC6043]RYH06966.1 LuxR family transcriptional regulator [Tropicimonas sp. IMCC6043]